jgi:hypothetical protein
MWYTLAGYLVCSSGMLEQFTWYTLVVGSSQSLGIHLWYTPASNLVYYSGLLQVKIWYASVVYSGQLDIHQWYFIVPYFRR